jgi:hypothetical protein
VNECIEVKDERDGSKEEEKEGGVSAAIIVVSFPLLLAL